MKWVVRYAFLHAVLAVWPTRTFLRRLQMYDEMREEETNG